MVYSLNNFSCLINILFIKYGILYKQRDEMSILVHKFYVLVLENISAYTGLQLMYIAQCIESII